MNAKHDEFLLYLIYTRPSIQMITTLLDFPVGLVWGFGGGGFVGLGVLFVCWFGVFL